MELHIHAPAWNRARTTDWAAAAVAGFAAGAVLMLLELMWAASTDILSGPWRISSLVAALAMGPTALENTGPSFGVLAVALVTHYVLGVVFGLVLGFLIGRLHYEQSAGMMQVLGVVFGAVLYFINFHVMTQFFPWFTELRGWATLIAHLVFGMTASLLYWKLARTGASRTADST